jgi:hypothetical protein
MRHLLLGLTLLCFGLASCVKHPSSCSDSATETTCGVLSEGELKAEIAMAERGDARAGNTLVVHYGGMQNYPERSKWLWRLMGQGDCHAAQIYYEDGHVSGGGNAEASRRAAELRQKTSCAITEIVVDDADAKGSRGSAATAAEPGAKSQQP